MKKKYTLILLAMALIVVQQIQSQDIHVSATGTLYVSPKSDINVTGSLEVLAGGDATISSDATHSGSLIVSGTATGDISYKKYIPDADWHFVSAPVETQSINDFIVDAANGIPTSGTNNYGVSTYDNTQVAGARWVYENTGTTPVGNFTTGKGYSNKRTGPGYYTFKGTMADAEVVITTTSSTAHKWEAVGNPYPSFLPANSAANGTNNLLAQNIDNLEAAYTYLSFWDGTAYQVINHASPALHITPGQAFMVRANANGSSFTFPENLQTAQVAAATTFYKGSETPEIILSLLNGTLTKTTTLKYFSNTTAGLDPGYDAGTYTDTTPTFAIDTHLVSDSQGIDFTLQCLPNNNFETSIVPLSIKAKANESITFIAESINLPTGLKVFLEDKVAQTVTDITTASHQVTPNETLNGIGRFYLHTAESVLSVQENDFATSLNMYKTSITNLRITGLELQGATAFVKMHTILGTVVMSTSFKAENVNDVALPENLATGIYLVQVVANGAKQTKKLIIE
jgi:hypothetical protein